MTIAYKSHYTFIQIISCCLISAQTCLVVLYIRNVFGYNLCGLNGQRGILPTTGLVEWDHYNCRKFDFRSNIPFSSLAPGFEYNHPTACKEFEVVQECLKTNCHTDACEVRIALADHTYAASTDCITVCTRSGCVCKPGYGRHPLTGDCITLGLCRAVVSHLGTNVAKTSGDPFAGLDPDTPYTL